MFKEKIELTEEYLRHQKEVLGKTYKEIAEHSGYSVSRVSNKYRSLKKSANTICQHCDVPFYTNRKGKYCSQECYFKDIGIGIELSQVDDERMLNWVRNYHSQLKKKFKKGQVLFDPQWLNFKDFINDVGIPKIKSKLELLPGKEKFKVGNVYWISEPVCKYCNQNHSKAARCKKKENYFKSVLTKDFLKRHYVDLGKSTVEISEEIGICFSIIHRKLCEFDLNRSVQEATNQSRARERRRNTCLDRYGVPHNFCKESESRKQWEARLLEEEGITNVFQREEVKEKIAKTFLERYGTECPHELSVARGKNTYSSVHQRVVEELIELGEDFEIEKKINNPDGRYYSFDLVFDDWLLVEINGDYWHGNPEMYSPDDIILKGSSKEMTVEEKWKKDKKKLDIARKAGYTVMVIWESDLNECFDCEIERILNAKSKN